MSLWELEEGVLQVLPRGGADGADHGIGAVHGPADRFRVPDIAFQSGIVCGWKRMNTKIAPPV